jgi:predicted hydrocarbon binding protein
MSADILKRNEAIIMRDITFSDFQKRLEALLSYSAATVILVEVGKDCGKRSAERLKEAQHVDGSELLSAIVQRKKEEAWGDVDFKEINLEQKRGYVIVRNCFEAVKYGHSDTPACHFMRGFLSGVLGIVLGQDIVLDEIACLVKGDQHCEFHIRP